MSDRAICDQAWVNGCRELSAKLQETLEMTEEQLDVALSRLCVRFDHDHYGRLDAAYRLLGKTQMAAHQLLMHFSSAVHNSALAVVRSHAAPESGQPPDLHKAQYADLCKLVPAERFLGCLVDLCQALWQVMCSYRALLCWHHDREPGPTAAAGYKVGDFSMACSEDVAC
ncbi:hypothetical protein V5799_014180 [Amblyomma americanum]|uniref:Vacuolar protein sorting-associated protein 54 N-terminal domain-containing protein n=1 Tax=Amblyomma americanum TaxID=6943 RepID=A0AAQ4E3S9_AMBAM